jgi:Ran GTPase-activating protein (RanGAP) involved in mRNA processing and transport
LLKLTVAWTQTLTSINLRFNNIGSAGMTSVAKALARHNCIQSLNLSANRIGPEGGLALAQTLARNSTLTSLDLFGNELEVRRVAFRVFLLSLSIHPVALSHLLSSLGSPRRIATVCA